MATSSPLLMMTRAALIVACVAVLAGVSPGAWAESANWIWSPDNAAAPQGACYFRRTFHVDDLTKIKAATVAVTADNSYRLYVNGRCIGQGGDWQTLDRYAIAPLLTSGVNVIAIEAVNGDGPQGPGGLVARVTLTDQQGATTDLSTGPTWRTSVAMDLGWRRAAHDDAAWKPAHVYGPLGATKPWGAVARTEDQPVKAPPKPRFIGGFELLDGDRVVMLGGTLIEREQQHGYLELALTNRWPDRHITFRNMGWSGDTVWAKSHGIFDVNSTQPGYDRLLAEVQRLDPTVIILGYGANESFEGDQGLAAFLSQLDKLVSDLEIHTQAAMVFLSPLKHENMGPPLPDPAPRNEALKRYAQVIQFTALERGYPYVDLFSGMGKVAQSSPSAPLTDNGIHLTARGYQVLAQAVLSELGLAPSAPANADGPRGWHIATHRSGKVFHEVGATMSDYFAFGESHRFHVTDYRLPMPGEKRVIAVDGMPPGVPYQLTIDDQVVAAADYEQWAEGVTITAASGAPAFAQAERLRQAILEKNELYFHRWRPQNVTYLFLFRKHEQGQNAREIPMFDPLIEEKEREIATLRKPAKRTYVFSPAKPLSTDDSKELSFKRAAEQAKALEKEKQEDGGRE